MGSGYAKKKKEAKMLERQFMEMEASLEQKRFSGEAGNGLVAVTINGKCDLIDVKIKPDCLDPEDPEVVADLFRAAFKAAKASLDSEMSAMHMGMPF